VTESPLLPPSPPAAERTRLRFTYPEAVLLVTTTTILTTTTATVCQSGHSSRTATNTTITTTMEAEEGIITGGLRRDSILFRGRGRDLSPFQILHHQVVHLYFYQCCGSVNIFFRIRIRHPELRVWNRIQEPMKRDPAGFGSGSYMDIFMANGKNKLSNREYCKSLKIKKNIEISSNL
jgi:hypothetical protein